VRSRCAPIAAALACALVAGCGGDGEERTTESPPPTAKRTDFPIAEGKTLAELLKGLRDGGPVLGLAVSQLSVGENRVGFGLFNRPRHQIAYAPAVVYVAPVGGGEARGPFPARYESLEVKPQFQSRNVAADPDAGRSVYVADVEFEKPGRYEMLGMARLDNRLVAAASATPVVRVAVDDPVPDVGDPAPRIHTPTEADVGGDVERIDTRVPPSSMHEVDFADVVGRKPVVLLFASPRLCVTRVCGPVVDVAEQVKADYGDAVEFIYMEPYRDNVVKEGFRPQMLRWRLPSEPWLFTIDGNGRIAARIDGAFSARELEEAVNRASAG
jgi:hypothetical protein